ncbi:MAG: hypothetical protein IH801_07030 [Nitrospinae bacterium]|nr:hypothetical protein [Nitrospinota bacterium]
MLLLIVVGILGSAWGAYRMTVGRPRLEGVRRHDFGLATLVNGRAEFDHTFVLTNTGSSTVEIVVSEPRPVRVIAVTASTSSQ